MLRKKTFLVTREKREYRENLKERFERLLMGKISELYQE